MTLRQDLRKLGSSLPPPGPDRGGRLAAALLTIIGNGWRNFRLSLDCQETALLNVLRSRLSLPIPGSIRSSDLAGCLETAISVRLAEEADSPDGQALASFYAQLWTLLEQADTAVHEEEIDSANEELESLGWLVVKTAGRWEAQPNGDAPGGVQLAMHEASNVRLGKRSAHQGSTWVQWQGPRGGSGWKNVNSGVIIYGGAKPGEHDTDLHKRIQASRERKLKDRKQRPPVHSELHKQIHPHAEHVPLDQQQRNQALRAYQGLLGKHGGLVVKRIEELASMVSNAIVHAPVVVQPALASKLEQLKAMFAKANEQKAGGQEEEEPRRQMIPKRT